MDTIIHSQPMHSNLIETTETDFNSTKLDDGTQFLSHTTNTWSLIDSEKNIYNNNNYRNEYIDTTNNTNIFESHRNHNQSIQLNQHKVQFY